MRRLMAVANWKMHFTVGEALQFVMGLNNSFTRLEKNIAEVVICPPFTALADVGRFLAQTDLKLGAQNVFYAEQGAYTGEISPTMLKDLNCTYVLVGHSERRMILKEDNETIGKKTVSALRNGLKPIVCVGETLEQRQKNQTESIIAAQLQAGLKDIVEDDKNRLTIAYEPVWAIGTGENATPEQANLVCQFIRNKLTELLGNNAGNQISILYGGSVKLDNVKELVRQPEIDGVLVGGASLKIQDFMSIVKAVK